MMRQMRHSMKTITPLLKTETRITAIALAGIFLFARMQLRAKICEAFSPNARSLQGTDSGAIQGHGRLENRRAKGRHDSRQVVGNVR